MIHSHSAGAAIVVLLATLGSASAQQTPAQATPPLPPVPMMAPIEADATYLLQVGDVIDVKFFYNAEMNETLPIRPDGKISLPLVNDIQAAGRTPSQLRDALIEQYRATLRQPELAVIVKEVAPRRVYVGGEVRTPSLLRIPGRITLLQALFEAGGLTRAGKTKDIVVLRYQGTQEPQFMKVDISPALERGDATADMLLEPFDIVWVPKTRIAKANDFMDQYFRQLVPIPLTLGISYVFGGLKP